MSKFPPPVNDVTQRQEVLLKMRTTGTMFSRAELGAKFWSSGVSSQLWRASHVPTMHWISAVQFSSIVSSTTSKKLWSMLATTSLWESTSGARVFCTDMDFTTTWQEQIKGQEIKVSGTGISTSPPISSTVPKLTKMAKV